MFLSASTSASNLRLKLRRRLFLIALLLISNENITFTKINQLIKITNNFELTGEKRSSKTIKPCLPFAFQITQFTSFVYHIHHILMLIYWKTFLLILAQVEYVTHAAQAIALVLLSLILDMPIFDWAKRHIRFGATTIISCK